jgi:hypothetical protein
VTFQVLFLAFLSWRVWKKTGVSMKAVDEFNFKRWVENREEFERDAYLSAFLYSKSLESTLPRNIIADEDEFLGRTEPDTTPDNEISANLIEPLNVSIKTSSASISLFLPSGNMPAEDTILPYNHLLSPELQAVRHSRFWLKPHSSLGYLVIVGFSILPIWLIGFLIATYAKGGDLINLWQLMLVFCLWLAAVIPHSNFMRIMGPLAVRFSLQPLDSSKLRNVVLDWQDVFALLVLDGMVSVAFTLGMQMPLSSAPICLALLTLVWIESFFCPVGLQFMVTRTGYFFGYARAPFSMFFPLLLGLYVYFFHPVMHMPGHVTAMSMFSLRENFLPAMFDLRTNRVMVPVMALGVLCTWAFSAWFARTHGGQIVTCPHVIPREILLSIEAAKKDKQKHAISKQKKNRKADLRTTAACLRKWKERFEPAIKQALRQNGATSDIIIAVEPEWVRRIDLDALGRGPYLEFDAPDDSLNVEHCGIWLDAATVALDKPMSVHIHVVGVSDDDVLFTIIEFLKPSVQPDDLKITWEPRWNESLPVHLGHDLQENRFTVYDARKDFGARKEFEN